MTAIRGVSADLPVVAQMAFNDERVTFLGQAPAEVARDLSALPVQVIGANCGVGSSVLYDVGLLLHETAPRFWVSIRPNAGLPSRHGERLIYLSSPGHGRLRLPHARWAAPGSSAAAAGRPRSHPRDAGGGRPPRLWARPSGVRRPWDRARWSARRRRPSR